MHQCIEQLGIILGTIGLLLGQAAQAAELSGIGAVLQGGAFAVLAYAFLHVLTKTLPAKDREHAKAVADLVSRQTDVVDKLAARQTDALDALSEAINNLRVHCAMVQQQREDRQA
jgi:membrane protein implicated in regulation of membrane protease activity